jgi:quercetin dioxygenase-like cupin family protein
MIQSSPIRIALFALGLVCAANAPAEVAQSVTSAVLAKGTASWDGSALPAYPQGAPEITVLKIVIPPGMRLPLHKHPVINAAYIVKGKLTVTTEENKRIALKAGDAIVEVVERWHYGRNDGTEPVEILVFYAGTPDTPITVKK